MRNTRNKQTQTIVSINRRGWDYWQARLYTKEGIVFDTDCLRASFMS
jgi:hypothetical protein